MEAYHIYGRRAARSYNTEMRIRRIAALLLPAWLGAQGFDSSRVQTWVEIFTRAREAERVQNHRLAGTLYDSVIALDPGNGIAYFHRAIVHNNLGDREKARADLQKSEALGNAQATFYL